MLIEKIKSILQEKCPQVKYDLENDNQINILCSDEDGFDIVVVSDEKENTIYLGSFHFHFENNEEGIDGLLNCLGFGMCKEGRIKAFLKNGKEYKWSFETLDDGKWHSVGSMGLINLQFWKKIENKYYQNNFIEIS